MFAKDGNSSQYFQCRSVSATGHDHIRLFVLVAASPLPDTNALRTMYDSGIHGKPLRERMLTSYYDVYIVPASQAMVHHRQQTICIRRQINANNIGLLVDNMIQKTRVLVRESIVILLPDM